jgi:hypothetical protein
MTQLQIALVLVSTTVALISCTTLPVPSPRDETERTSFPHDDLDSFLGRVVDEAGMVDYAGAIHDQADLSRTVAHVAAVSPDSSPTRFASDDDRLAYWINTYNAWVVHAVLARYPIASVRDVRPPWPLFFLPRLAGFFYLQRITVGGKEMSLLSLENDLILRRFPDPRIHFALNCASESCPRLPRRAFRGESLEEALEAEARRFIRDPRNLSVRPEEGVVHLSSIFDWYERDFVAWLETHHPAAPATLRGYVALYLDEDAAIRLASCTGCRIEFIPSDWALNDQARERRQAD